MGFIIGVLTFIMVLDCLVLILLILVQLPKKEAGAGLAFGGAASDALFGAGSGTVLTKITKYAAGTFFTLAIILAIMQSRYQNRSGSEFQRILDTPGAAASGSAAASSTQKPLATAPATTTTATNALMSLPASGVTNAAPVSAPATSAPAASAPQPGAK